MEGQYKPKVTARLGYERHRPTSPFKSPTTSLSPPQVVKPRAKINSSATITSRKTTTASSTISVRSSASSVAPSPRATSPFKPTQTRVAPTPPSGGPVKARITARANGTHPMSTVAESRQRGSTGSTTASEVSARGHSRRGSVSSHASSFLHSEFQPLSIPPPSPSLPIAENGPPSARGFACVKGKVAKFAESAQSSPSLSPSPRYSSNRPLSISGLPLASPLLPHNVNSSQTRGIHHHRFATARESRTYPQHSFSPNDDLAISYGAHIITAKVDPATIPLPSQSPPTSTLSFSSRSSASRSSASYDYSDVTHSTAPTLNSLANGHSHSHGRGHGHLRQASRTSLPQSSPDEIGTRPEPPSVGESSLSDGELLDDVDAELLELEEYSDNSDRKMKAEAKSNRKIEDLEISNRSLLSINTTLEATKHRQAKEIRDLRRKLRESRLILPPPTFRAVQSTLTHDDAAEDEDEDEEEDEEDAEAIEGKDDETYWRVKVMVEGLLDTCRRALESKPEDFTEGGKSGAKVLSAEEVRTWRGDNAETRSIVDVIVEGEVDVGVRSSSRPMTPSRIAVPNSDDGLDSEDEVEAFLEEPDTKPPAPLPPITVTHS